MHSLTPPKYPSTSQRITRYTLLLGAVCLSFFYLGDLAAQTQSLWKYKYFAGDPPNWKDANQLWGSRAECEAARAEKSSQGYPVGDCYALPTAQPQPATTPPAQKSAPTTTRTPQNQSSSSPPTTTAEMERLRKEKLREGCLVQCNTSQRACLAALPDLEACIQGRNADCIEQCTRVEQLPHHQCINEVCLPSEVNQASWQGLCETDRQRAQSLCNQQHLTCTQSCS